MVLLATNIRHTKSVSYSKSNLPDSALDDLSVAVTLKQSNVTIQQNTMSSSNSSTSTRINEMKLFLTEFLVSLGDDCSVAERIINDAFVAPNRIMELIDELSQLYLQKFRFEDTGKCATAIIYAGHLRVLRMFDIRELLPTSETEQSNSIGTASTLTMSTSESAGNIVTGSTTQRNVQDTGSPAGMILDTSNVAIGSAIRDRNNAQDAIASFDLIEGASDVVMDRGNDDASAVHMSMD